MSSSQHPYEPGIVAGPVWKKTEAQGYRSVWLDQAVALLGFKSPSVSIPPSQRSWPTHHHSLHLDSSEVQDSVTLNCQSPSSKATFQW